MVDGKQRERLNIEVNRVLAAIPDENEKLLRGYEFAKKYSQINDYVSADKYISKYLSVRSENAAAWRLAGDVYEKLSKWGSALTAYKRSFELDTLQADLLPKICEIYREIPDNQMDSDAQHYWKLASEHFKDDIRVRTLELKLAAARSRGATKKSIDLISVSKRNVESPQQIRPDLNLNQSKLSFAYTNGSSPNRAAILDSIGSPYGSEPITQRRTIAATDKVDAATLRSVDHSTVEPQCVDETPLTNGGRLYERVALEHETVARLVETVTSAQTATFREFAATLRDELAASRDGDSLRREVESVRRELDTVRRELDTAKRERDERSVTASLRSAEHTVTEQHLRSILDRVNELQTDMSAMRDRHASFSKDLQALRSEIWQTFAPIAVFVNSLSQFVPLPGAPHAAAADAAANQNAAFRAGMQSAAAPSFGAGPIPAAQPGLGLLPAFVGQQQHADLSNLSRPLATSALPGTPQRPAGPVSASPPKPVTAAVAAPAAVPSPLSAASAPKPGMVFGANIFSSQPAPAQAAPAAAQQKPANNMLAPAQQLQLGQTQVAKPSTAVGTATTSTPLAFTNLAGPQAASTNAALQKPKGATTSALAEMLSQPQAPVSSSTPSANREAPSLNFAFSNLSQQTAAKSVTQPPADAPAKGLFSFPAASASTTAKPFSGFSFVTSGDTKQQPAAQAPASSLFTFSKPANSAKDVAPAAAKNDADEQDGDDDHDQQHPSDFEPQVEFAPLVTLPNSVEVRTGEEEEEKVFGERAKLYRYDAESKSWKERGIGEIKLLRHVSKNTYRLLMRREQVLKLCLNHSVTAALELHPFADTDRKAYIWAAQDFSEGELRNDRFAVRFKSEDIAAQFHQAIADAKKHLSARPASDAPAKSSDSASKTNAKPADGLFDKFKPAAGTWQCGICALFNDAAAEKCQACQTANPKAKPKTDAPAATATSAAPSSPGDAQKAGAVLAPARFVAPSPTAATDSSKPAAQANTFGKVFDKLQASSGASLFGGATTTSSGSGASLFGGATSTASNASSMSSFSFKFGTANSNPSQPAAEQPSARPNPFAGFSFASKGADATTTKPSAANQSSKSSNQSGGDDDVQIIRTVTANPEQRARARRLGLPDDFYAFENELVESRAELGVIDIENFTAAEGEKLQRSIAATKRHPRSTRVKSEKEESSASVATGKVKNEPQTSVTDKSSKGASQAEPFILGLGTKTVELSFAGLAQQNSGSSFQFGSSGFALSSATPASKDFKFAGAGTPLFGGARSTVAPTTPQAARTEADGDDADEEEGGTVEHECTAEFKPVLSTLPELINTRTGEEDDIVLFSERARLYHFINREWKERGIGNVKVSQVRSNGRIRLLLRREQVHKLAANHYITRGIAFSEMGSTRAAFTWQAVDSSVEVSSPDDLNKPVIFSIRFKNEQLATRFIETIRSLQAEMNKRSDDALPLREGESQNAAADAPASAPPKPTDTEKCPAGEAVKNDPSQLGQLLNEDANTSNATADGGDGDQPDDEEDSVMFSRRTTLHIKQGNDFKKLALGELRMVYDSELYLARILLKNEQLGKVVCDCVVTTHSKVDAAKHGKSFDVDFVAEDAQTGEGAQPVMRTYRACFASQLAQNEFVEQFEQGIECARGAEMSEVADADTTEISRPEVADSK